MAERPISETETVTTAAGISQLRRRWAVGGGEPRAAVLLVHGVAEHSGRYEHVGAYLAANGLDVLAFDLRGHGGSGGRRGHVTRFAQFLDDVGELLGQRRSLGVPVVLMGHSLGGLIATAYVVSDRPEPDLLVLSSPALEAQVPGWQRAIAPVLSLLAPSVPIPNDLDGDLLSRDPAVGEAYRDDPLRVRTATARLGNEIFKAMAATAASIGEVTLPTYVLHGAEDRLVPPSASEPFGRLHNATRVVHDDLRHECLNEPDREVVLAAMLAWIDGQLARIDGQPD